MQKTWEKIKSKKVFSCYKFDVFEDDVIKPDGSKGKYYYRNGGASVAIIPFDGKNFILVNQYRYVLKKRLWQLPVGKSENNNYLQQAKKELREETGVRAKKWKFLGQFYASPGNDNCRGQVFLAQGLEFGKHEREGSESDMIMKSFSLKQIDNMIKEGRIVDGWTISAMYLFKLNFLKS